MHIEPYLFFEGRYEEAIDFYHDALGAEVQMMLRFKESPQPEMIPPGGEEKIMHATLTIGSTSLMTSDGHCGGTQSYHGFSLSIAAADKAEAERYFDALRDGGEVTMPLEQTFWSPAFGMVTDRFGVSWMVNVMG